MRRCLQKTSSLHYYRWKCRGLRTSPLSQPRKPAVKQLSNVELLELVEDAKEDIASTPATPPESEHVSASASRLPQSPLTDPRLLAARNRYRAEKPFPSKDRSPFQVRLQKNPYAYALSTPPRLCLLTGVRLPSYFMIPFGLASHPKTGAPWHLPKLSIESEARPRSADGVELNPNETTLASSQTSPATKSDNASPILKSTRSGTGTHFLASREVLKYISGDSGIVYNRMMPFRWKGDAGLKPHKLVWREDMETFVLEILRKKLSKNLVYLASRPAAYIASCRDHNHISKHDQVAAVLWLGSRAEDEYQDSSLNDITPSDAQALGPPPYAMHYLRSYYIPVYNLPSLLGPVHLRALQDRSSAHFANGNEYAVIKGKRATMKVQLELWKLLGYLAQDGRVCGKSAAVPDSTAVEEESET